MKITPLFFISLLSRRWPETTMQNYIGNLILSPLRINFRSLRFFLLMFRMMIIFPFLGRSRSVKWKLLSRFLQRIRVPGQMAGLQSFFSISFIFLGVELVEAIKDTILTSLILETLLGPRKLQVTIVWILPNKRSQLARYCLVWGIRPIYDPAIVDQVTVKVFYRLQPDPPQVFFIVFFYLYV